MIIVVCKVTLCFIAYIVTTSCVDHLSARIEPQAGFTCRALYVSNLVLKDLDTLSTGPGLAIKSRHDPAHIYSQKSSCPSSVSARSLFHALPIGTRMCFVDSRKLLTAVLKIRAP